MNSRSIKYIKIAVYIIFLILPIFLIKETAYADSYASRYAWRDDAGNIILRTEDHQRTSDICYQTLGWTITRCSLGSQNAMEEQYITVRFNGSLQDVPIGNGYTTSAFVVSESEFQSKIAGVSGDWLADIQSEQPCWLRFDAIMCTWDYSNPLIGQFSGWMESDNNQDYKENPFYIPSSKKGVYDKFSKEDLKRVYGWASPQSIDTHYDIYLLYNGGEEPEPIVSDELIERTGKSKPEFYTWNNSDQFDLFDGIPSGEDITNGYGADNWYGNFGIAKHIKEKEYIVSYDFIYHIYTEVDDYDWEDEDGDGIEEYVKVGSHTEDNVYHYPRAFKFKRIAAYYYVLGINLYELSDADVYNSVYPGDVINYDIPSSIPMEVELDGVINPNVVSDWTSDEEVHIKWPEPYHGTIAIDCGEGMGSAQRMYNRYDNLLHDDEITSEDPVKGVTVKNDLVEINGVKYMDNKEVENVVDATKKLIPYKRLSPAKDDAMYLFKEEDKTVTIPKEVANGSYATEVEVTYKKRILNDNSMMAFTSATDGISQHLKPGYEQNEPVFVHTPVIAPASILDEEQTTQLITENRSDYSEADKEGNMPDGKAAYELILDNTYTIKFDPTMHRDIKGYGYSGDPSKFDKYVKGKYVRFPFAIQMDGKFYKANKEDGYTEWIEVDNYEFQFYIPPWSIENKLWNIQFKVEAYNVNDENGVNHSNDKEGTANVTLNGNGEAINYVATYNIPIELSGIIYNFEVVGCSNYGDYTEMDDLVDEHGNVVSGDIAFCPRKEEKKQGNKNRLGTNTVRYTLDGMTTNTWQPVNTLPMAMETSKNQTGQGYLKCGETIWFSLKTISNLWDETGDSIEITPTFRFYDKYGNEHKDIQVYYMKDQIPILIGSKADKSNAHLFSLNKGLNAYRGSLFDAKFSMDKPSLFKTNAPDYYKGTYHDTDLWYTINKKPYGASLNTLPEKEQLAAFSRFIFTQDTNEYHMNHITLDSKLRTLTGNYEELAVNVDTDKGNLALSDFNVDTETDDKMAYSMQTWYGEYQVPGSILICDADTFENLGATDQDENGVIDYYDYLIQFIPEGKDKMGNEVHGVDDESKFWLQNDFPYGYLMLNFDIRTKNNNKNHLSYWSGNGNKDMWKLQGKKDTAKYGDRVLKDTTNGKWPIQNIEVKSGDVAFINPSIKQNYLLVQGLMTN